MSSLIRLRPRDDTLYVSQNETVLATDRDGMLNDGVQHGLFYRQTRLLSKYSYEINGQRALPVALSNIEQHTWLGYYIAAPSDLDDYYFGTIGPGGKIAQQTIELRVSRTITNGMREEIDITNFTTRAQTIEFRITLDGDFADIEETKGHRRQHGDLRRLWHADISELELDYSAEHDYNEQGNQGHAAIHRGVIIRFDTRGELRYTNTAVVFPIRLQPQETWHCSIHVTPVDEGVRKSERLDYDERRRDFLSTSTEIETHENNNLSWLVQDALDQAKQDLAALRLYSLDKDDNSWTLAAGLPIYLALFGRDTLTSSWQASLLSPDLMKGTLAELARLQGVDVNDWREEQPGRMLHQADTGPLASLNFSPLARYYSSITTSGFYPFVVSELWHWTGNKELVAPFIEPALRALKWLDEWADIDGDGFYEYHSVSKQGNQNQGWKDSGDAIVYEDGTNVFSPIATCEEQAFVYAAKLHFSETLWSLGHKGTAAKLFHQAGELKKRFNDRFWMEDENFFAMALDSKKSQVRSIGSNAGHCIASGIVDASRIQATADRLFAPDMFSGWGVRTLSSQNPAYNPYSYHRGSVWPVEQGTFALGFTRYGLHERTDQISRALFDASALFDHRRLPELFSGHSRETNPFPAHYPGANSPQAWSASAMFSFVQAMLGLYPYAPMRMLLVDPHLPDWLPSITLRRLHVGDASVTIRFWRNSDGTSDFRVLDQEGRLHVLRQPSPWSLTATGSERFVDLITSFLPGNLPSKTA